MDLQNNEGPTGNAAEPSGVEGSASTITNAVVSNEPGRSNDPATIILTAITEASIDVLLSEPLEELPASKTVVSSDLRVIREFPEYETLIVELPNYHEGVQRHAVILQGGGDRCKTLRLVRALHARKLLPPNLHFICGRSSPNLSWGLILDAGDEQADQLLRAVASIEWAFGGEIYVGRCDEHLLAVAEGWTLGWHDAPEASAP